VKRRESADLRTTCD